MATVAERRSLPSPEIMLGQPWSSWVDATKLHGHDDMPIFGQCPAQDDFYLVMCSHCGHVVKPQAFQAHYGTFYSILFYSILLHSTQIQMQHLCFRSDFS
uniref:Ataxin 7 n=1 Tax=Nothobranchius furzeri TaxID=105023 RepID=A0A8C6VZD0_NOTFU